MTPKLRLSQTLLKIRRLLCCNISKRCYQMQTIDIILMHVLIQDASDWEIWQLSSSSLVASKLSQNGYSIAKCQVSSCCKAISTGLTTQRCQSEIISCSRHKWNFTVLGCVTESPKNVSKDVFDLNVWVSSGMWCQTTGTFNFKVKLKEVVSAGYLRICIDIKDQFFVTQQELPDTSFNWKNQDVSKISQKYYPLTSR